LPYKLQFLHEEDSYNNATKENLLMPKVAIFFCIILLTTVSTNSYAFTPGDMVFEESLPKQIEFNSDIIQIDSNFFVENNFKRYLIFGTNSQNPDFFKKPFLVWNSF